MPTRSALLHQLGLPPDDGEQTAFRTPDEAVQGLPDHPAAEVRTAALALLAQEALTAPGLPALLTALRGTLAAPRPEQELTALLARLTGGQAEIRASWGDRVAGAGVPAGPPVTLRLTHGERSVGSLLLALPPGWQGLEPVAQEYALLARLQSAAAGAARRRVGERLLDALLGGTYAGMLLDGEPYALALATLSREAGPGAHAQQGRAAALDVLAAVGEGYFRERRAERAGGAVSGLVYSSVRDDRAVWLWPTHDLEAEARGLHMALTASTAQDVRLGVSGRQVGTASAPQALDEARQALAATREARGYTTFHGMDALYALLSGGALRPLRDQLRARLATLDDRGRTEATLRAYLNHAGPLSELAGRLNLHVNTLRYRLRRAEDALGGSLSDPQMVARLYLAFEAERG